MFPNAGQLVAQHHVFLIFGPFFLTISGTAWWYLRHRHPRPSEAAHDVQVALLGIVFFLGGLVHTFGAYVDLASSLHEQIDLARVVAIRVTKIDSTGTPFGMSHVVTNTAQLQTGFQQLWFARNYPARKGEIWSDGLQIQVQYVDDRSFSDHALFVYRRSNDTNRAVAVVIPRVASGQAYTYHTYDAPAFHRWVRTTIDPLFSTHEGPP